MGASLQKTSRFSGGRRQRAGGFSEINVTPLVDVMLVLLVVFMITAPMMTSGIPLDLPKTKAAKLNDQSDPIVISVDETGRSFLNKTELAGEALIARLMIVTEQNPEAKIYIRGDSKLAYGRIMEVMGEISAAGFTKISLMAEMLPGQQASSGPLSVSKVGAADGSSVGGTLPVGNPSGNRVTQRTPVSSSQQGTQKGLPTLQSLMPSVPSSLQSQGAPASGVSNRRS